MHVWSSETGKGETVPTRHGGSAFSAHVTQDVCRLLGTKHEINVAHHPQSHGVIERANRTLLATIRTMLAAPGNTAGWTDLLPAAQLALNTATSRVTGYSPFELLHGFPARSPLQAATGLEQEVLEADEFAVLLSNNFQRMQTTVIAAEQRAAADMIRTYETSLRSRTPAYEVGQYVLLRNFSPLSKLSLPWNGPYLVTALNSASEVTLQDLVDTNHSFKAHLDNIAPLRLHPDEPAPQKEQALREGEFVVERVLDDYEGADDRWWFIVKWAGYADGVDPGVCLADCRKDPIVRAYIKAKKPHFTRRQGRKKEE